MQYFLICYDIEQDTRRNRMAKCLLRWGRRVQYSVFEMACKSQADYKRLCAELEKIRQADDNVRIYCFNQNTRMQSGELNGQPMRHCPAVIIL